MECDSCTFKHFVLFLHLRRAKDRSTQGLEHLGFVYLPNIYTICMKESKLHLEGILKYIKFMQEALYQFSKDIR